ncbi:MAG: dephospho-CoA kinase [Planctomycetota bacterium]|nr:dephospho-CoA kinase [Planctomycetota bacterium]
MTTPPQPPKLIVVGVSGGIGSGKSTAAREICHAVDGHLIDADSIVSGLIQSQEVVNDIVSEFGDAVCNPERGISRHALGKLVFESDEARKRLEAILHPLVRQKIFSEMEILASRHQTPRIILDIPLLHEGGLDKLCDFIVFVDCPDEVRWQRVQQRNAWSKEHWQQREQMQIAIDSKKSMADAILCNVSSLSELSRQVLDLIPRLNEIQPRPLSARWPVN